MGKEAVMLRFHDVSVGYGNETIVEDVSLTLEKGRILGLIGPNGGGKSTLVRALYGQADILSGSIQLEGRDFTTYTPPQRARLIGVLPQSIVAPFPMTARQFVRLGSVDALLGTPDDSLDRTTEDMLDLADCTYLASRSIMELSGGELQRLYFAQALINDPTLLVLDEPTSHLDINHRLYMLDSVHALVRDSQKMALIVFHDFDLAFRYADELVVISPRVVSSPDLLSKTCAAIASPQRPPGDILTPEMFATTFGVEADIEKDKIVFFNRVVR